MRNTTTSWIYITLRDGQLSVIAMDVNDNDLFTTTGFNSVEECWEYARMLAKGAGVPEYEINNDVFDEPRGPFVENQKVIVILRKRRE